MPRIIAITLVGIIAATSAWAQDATDDGSSLADGSPSTNASGESLRERAPGNIIREALDRHRGLINERVNGVESDNPLPVEPDGGTGGSGSGGGLDGLLDSLGGGGSLTELAGGLSSFLGGSGTSGATGGLSEDAIQQAIEDAVAAAGGTTARETDADSRFELSGGAFDRLPKTELREQSVVEPEEDSFRVRLVNAWLGALFTSLTFGFQTQDFIDLLESGLRPLFTPPSNGGGDGDGDGGDGGDGGSGGNGSGVEDVDSGAGDSGDGSVVKPVRP